VHEDVIHAAEEHQDAVRQVAGLQNTVRQDTVQQHDPRRSGETTPTKADQQ